MASDHAHSHAPKVAGNERRLLIALGLTAGFLVVEVVGGILTQSLALLSDAAHMFTDVTALAIALAAVRVARRPVDDRRSYGYQRFEILAAAFNALLLFAVAAYILYEAWQRFRTPAEVNAGGMLAIAAVGLVVNFVSLKLLSAGRDESLNVKGAYLEVWSDMLGSAGVMVAAIAIHFTGWRWLDPLVAVAIGLWVLPRTWLLLKESLHILLEGTPAGISVKDITEGMQATTGVVAIHDLHVWTLTSGNHVLTAHVVVEGMTDRQALLESLSKDLRERFKLTHTTLQLESEACADLHEPLHKAPGLDDHAGHAH